MNSIRITKQEYLSSAATYYHATRNGITYYLSDNYGWAVDVQQRYIKRNGTAGQRRVPEGKLRAELVAALEQHKAALLRERICTPVTIGEAGALLA